VRRLDQVVVAADRQRLGVGERLLETRSELVHAHGRESLHGGRDRDVQDMRAGKSRFKRPAGAREGRLLLFHAAKGGRGLE
jgi:hypothetical protein